MARDRAACVARQEAVSRHGVRRSRRALGRAGRAWAGGSRRAGSAAGSWARGVRALGERERRRRRAAAARGARVAGRDRGSLGARPGRWARGLATGCALGLFSIRFDSVLFLSRFLDIIREPGS